MEKCIQIEKPRDMFPENDSLIPNQGTLGSAH